MSQEPQSLKSVFNEAESARIRLETLTRSQPGFATEAAFALARYEKCLEIADQVSLFSPNETLEDVSSSNLEYFLIHFRISEIIMKQPSLDRNGILFKARREVESFLRLLDSYDILSKDDAKLYERYRDSSDKFSTASTTDAAARRNTKIARHKEEKALREKLDHLRRNPTQLENDDETLRQLHLTSISYATYQAFSSLESIAQELHILSLAPPPDPTPDASKPDSRTRDPRTSTEYSERLDAPMSSLLAKGNAGPILDKQGKPLRPFTILDRRAQVQQGVFRPDHNLPTMSIDEYLEEERRRGGIIEGGGAQSGLRPEPDEDNVELADRETMKAREWDEFKEENPRGAGNTMNMG